MRVALYARVSTDDRDQDPETQLVALRDYCAAQGWEVVGEYVDHAPARDLGHRDAWRRLLADAARRRFRAVVVFRLDRAFRSVKHMYDTLERWEAQGVTLRSVREQLDTSSAFGRFMLTLLGALAELELGILQERVQAGMERARREGRAIGRPRVRVGVQKILDAYARLGSVRAVARELGISPGVAYARLREAGALSKRVGHPPNLNGHS